MQNHGIAKRIEYKSSANEKLFVHDLPHLELCSLIPGFIQKYLATCNFALKVVHNKQLTKTQAATIKWHSCSKSNNVTIAKTTINSHHCNWKLNLNWPPPDWLVPLTDWLVPPSLKPMLPNWKSKNKPWGRQLKLLFDLLERNTIDTVVNMTIVFHYWNADWNRLVAAFLIWNNADVDSAAYLYLLGSLRCSKNTKTAGACNRSWLLCFLQ